LAIKNHLKEVAEYYSESFFDKNNLEGLNMEGIQQWFSYRDNQDDGRVVVTQRAMYHLTDGLGWHVDPEMRMLFPDAGRERNPDG
jgi:hypothetical protein